VNTPADAVRFAIGAVWAHEGIAWIRYDAGARFELQHVQPMRDAIRAVVPSGKALVLSDTTQLSGVSGEARATGNDPESVAIFGALAILGGSPLGRMVGNFFIRTSRPSYPTRIFTDVAAATAWLRTFEAA